MPQIYYRQTGEGNNCVTVDHEGDEITIVCLSEFSSDEDINQYETTFTAGGFRKAYEEMKKDGKGEATQDYGGFVSKINVEPREGGVVISFRGSGWGNSAFISDEAVQKILALA